jgi:RNA polymerase sigma-70 factor (family 1)
MKNNNKFQDSNLSERIKSGDVLAYNELFEKSYSKLFNYILKLSNNTDVTKDVVQEAFIKLWKKRALINSDFSIENYLFKICYNEFLIHIRRKNKEKSLLDELKFEIAYDLYIDNDTSQINKINQAIDKLPTRTKEAFILSKYNNLKYKEIAVEMDISIKTVEKHVSKALKFLKANVLFLFF